MQRSRPQRGHQPNATRHQRQRALTGRGKQPFCFEFGLKPQELLKPGALPGSAHALNNELQVPPSLIDTQAAAHFDQLTVARRSTSPRGAQIVFLATPNSEEEIEICQMPPGAPAVVVQPDLMHLAFEVEDLAEFTRKVEAKGFKLSDGPTKSGSGSVIAFIDAPEGYEVELIQRAK